MSSSKSLLILSAVTALCMSASANPWWEAPYFMGGHEEPLDNNVDGPLSAALDADLGYYALPARMASGPFVLYRTQDVFAGNFGNPVYTIKNNDIVAAGFSGFQIRGASFNKAQNRLLAGSYKGEAMLSLPLEVNLADGIVFDGNGSNPNTFAITNSIGLTLDFFHFSQDGTKLYSSAQNNPYRNNVYVFDVKSLTASGVQLMSNKVISVGERIRGSTYAVVGGKEIYYAALDGKKGVCAVDLASGTVSTLISNSVDNLDLTYGDIAVTGTGAGRPHLSLFGRGAGNDNGSGLRIYDLTPNGMGLVSQEPIYELDAAGAVAQLLGGYGTSMNGATLDMTDEENIVIAGRGSKAFTTVYQPTVEVINIGEKCNVEVRIEGQDGDAVGRPVLPTDTIRCTLYPLPRVFTAFAHIDGKPCEIDELGHFSGKAGATGRVVISYARNNAWYLDPVEKNRIAIKGVTTYSPWGGLLDEENGLYFASVSCNNYGGGEAGIVQIDAAQLMESRATDQEAMNWTTKSYTNNTETTRDFAYSAKYGVILSSGFSGQTNTVVAYPLGGSWKQKAGDPDDRYIVSNDLGRRLYPAAFDHDSTYFYAVHSNGDPEPDSGSWVNDSYNASLGKFRPVEDVDGKLIGFEFIEDVFTGILPDIANYACYVGVVRTFYDAANDREIVYVAGRNGVTAVDVSTTPPTVVQNWFKNAGPYDENYPSLNITGLSVGTPHLVLNRSTGLGVYVMMPDLMTMVSTEPIVSYTKADPHFSIMEFTGNAMVFCGFGATEDEKYLFFNAPHKSPFDGENAKIGFHTFLFVHPLVKNAVKETILIFR